MVETRKGNYQHRIQKRKAQVKELKAIALRKYARDPSGSGNQDLEQIYSNVKSVPNYSAKIAEFLRNNVNHSVHRRISKKKFPRRRIITQFPFQIFQADLIEYSARDYSYLNNGYKFILVVIDCFSKMVYARPVKRKNADYMSDAFESIFSNFDQFPNSIITDRGLEFYNSKVQAVFTKYGINHYSTKTKTPWKASMAERVIRTLKSRLQKYFYKTKSKKWVDFLPDLIKNYNSTPHRTIGMAPDQVTVNNSDAIYKKQFKTVDFKVAPRLEIGDKVRILEDKTLFEKGYTRNWSEKIYKVTRVIQKSGIVWYKVADLEGNVEPGIKYYWQLNLVSKS